MSVNVVMKLEDGGAGIWTWVVRLQGLFADTLDTC